MTRRKQRSFGLDELYYRVPPVIEYIEEHRQIIPNPNWRIGRPGPKHFDTLNGIQLQPRHKRRIREWPDRERVGISSVDTMLVHYELTSGLFELWCHNRDIDPLWRPTPTSDRPDKGNKSKSSRHVG